jgi:hypothetical protein
MLLGARMGGPGIFVCGQFFKNQYRPQRRKPGSHVGKNHPGTDPLAGLERESGEDLASGG